MELGVDSLAPPIRETVCSQESEPSSATIVKTLVYFFRIQVIAARCWRLANLEDPRLLRLPNERFLRRNVRLLKTILIIINLIVKFTHKPNSLSLSLSLQETG